MGLMDARPSAPPTADTGPDGWTRLPAAPCAHGACPVWRGLEDRLYWLDTAELRLWRLHVPSGHSEWQALPGAPGALAPCRRGGWLIALRDGIYHLAGWGLPLERLVDAPYDTRRLHVSTATCDPWGRLWLATSVDARDRAEGAVYCLRARDRQRPELTLVQTGAVTSNGLAWSPDGTRLYWADPHRHTIDTLPLSTAGRWPPTLGARLLLRRFQPRPTGAPAADTAAPAYGGRPAGATIDSAGRYWVAMEEGGRVVCLDERGHIVTEWSLPARCPTALCFGGPDLRTLFVTTARRHRSAAELAQFPDSGSVWSRRVSVPGRPAPLYWD